MANLLLAFILLLTASPAFSGEHRGTLGEPVQWDLLDVFLEPWAARLFRPTPNVRFIFYTEAKQWPEKCGFKVKKRKLFQN